MLVTPYKVREDWEIMDLPLKFNSFKIFTNKTCFPLSEDLHQRERFELRALHLTRIQPKNLDSERYFLLV